MIKLPKTYNRKTSIMKIYLILKKIAQVIKLWWPTILVLPPILGGIWQIAELCMIDPTFIRFFSSTQLLSDGLLILLIFTGAVIPLIISLLILNIITFTTNINKTSIKKCKKEGNAIGLFLVAIMIFIFTIENSESLYKDINLSLDKLSLFVFLGNLIIVNLLLSFSFVGFQLSCQCFNKNFKNKIKKYKLSIMFRVISILVVVLVDIFAIFVLTYVVLLFIHYKFSFPDNLTNIKYLDSKMKNENYISNVLLYSNDKYIFIEHTDKNKSKSIEILKFDDLFIE